MQREFITRLKRMAALSESGAKELWSAAIELERRGETAGLDALRDESRRHRVDAICLRALAGAEQYRCAAWQSR